MSFKISNNKFLFKIGVCLFISAILIIYFLFVHPFAMQMYDTWMEFNNLQYPKLISEEWAKKPSSFLYFQAKIPNSQGRKGLALGILSKRKDERALPILKSIITKGNSDLNYYATQCLIEFGEKETVSILMPIVNKYKNMHFESTDKKHWKDYDRYSDALRALAILKYESAYPIIQNLARNGTVLEKQSVFMGMLYYYDNHWEEVLSLYNNWLKDKNSGMYKSGLIETIKKLNRPEAIPILRDLAGREPWNQKDAEEAIKYLESLKNNQ